MWHEDRFRPLTAALVNLALNLVLVQFIGVYGILLSTVLAITCVGMPWLLHNLFTVVFERKFLGRYLKRIFFYLIVVIFSCVITYLICLKIVFNPLSTLIVRGIICLIVPNIIYFFLYRNCREYEQVLELANVITKGRVQKLLRKLGMEHN